MRFERYFTKTHHDPYHELRFVERTSELKHPDGRQAGQALRIIAPETWSQIACDILAQRYCLRKGVPDTGRETDARQVFHRMASCWTSWGERYGYFDRSEDASVFYDELCYMLAHQICAPNSPQWFNTGLFHTYGMKGPGQGHYYVEPESGEVKAASSAYERPQPHACFIQSVSDDLVNEGGIMDLWIREARLFKYGSGTGSNFSHIRGQGEGLSGGGLSSGLMSFLKIGDRAAGAIKSGGTTRRAAKMVCLDLDHPDIEEFIHWKVTEEHKVAALAAGSRQLEFHLKQILQAYHAARFSQDAAPDVSRCPALRQAILEARRAQIPAASIQKILDLGREGFTDLTLEVYDTDWDSAAYATVSGQNSNNSVRVPHRFMKQVADNGDWELRYRSNGQVARTLKARELWKDIALAAWSCADPGVQFDTTINEWHTCPADGEIRASNPCSEYMFLDDTACNLASLNVLALQKTDGLDVEAFVYACRMWTVVLDISVQMAQFPSKAIAQRSWDYRTLGLGYANLGALVMQAGLPYGSPAAQAWTAGITALMGGICYRTSAEMAASLGAFPAYDRNARSMLRVIRNHRRAAYNESDYEGLSILPQGLNADLCPGPILQAARLAWDEALALGERHGYRNAQTTVIAPTGTIGLLMDCDTTGIEPDYAIVKFKKLAGGGYFKLVNQSVPIALRNLGYPVREIEAMVHHCVGHGTLKGAPSINHDSLKHKGFTDQMLSSIEAELPSAFDINFVFNPWLLGQDACAQDLGLDRERLSEPSVSILRLLGFSDQEIEAANAYACGTMSMEDAPFLQEEHLPIFDCSSPCGRRGRRSITPEAHIAMMAAAQPFLSGAISKTVNLPAHASICDVQRCYELAWSSMIKAIAIYRDGSKLSQPLQSSALSLWENLSDTEQVPVERVRKLAQAATSEWISRRRPLPARRSGYTQKAKIGGHSIYLRTGEYEDGTIGEIFLDINKEGTLLRSMMNCFAIAVSLGLQYGVPLDEFVDVFTFTRFEPNGIVTGHVNIKRATSIIDFIFRDLALQYLERHDLAHVPLDREEPNRLSGDDTESQMAEYVAYREARLKGYEGDPCSSCGALTLVRNGSCLKCMSCGSTNGCS
jgi:ribonucleoside-diphosphate reductase alpha chain